MRSLIHFPSAVAAILMGIALVSCAHPQMANPPSGEAPTGGFYEGVIGVYTGSLNHLEGVRRGSCPMYPSCSQYSRQAVARHGFAKGWVMTMDRLMRCGRDELDSAPKVFANGDWRFYDPVEQNEWSAHRNERLASEPGLLPSP